MRASALAVKPAEPTVPAGAIGTDYRDVLALVERLHRRLLDVVRDEFDRHHQFDLNAVQALLVYNVGDNEVTASELSKRGYYLGSNVSYNLKKLVDTGFLNHTRSRSDRRSVSISLTEKGRAVHRALAQLFAQHVLGITDEGQIAAVDLGGINKTLLRLERFWTDQIRYRL